MKHEQLRLFFPCTSRLPAFIEIPSPIGLSHTQVAADVDVGDYISRAVSWKQCEQWSWVPGCFRLSIRMKYCSFMWIRRSYYKDAIMNPRGLGIMEWHAGVWFPMLRWIVRLHIQHISKVWFFATDFCLWISWCGIICWFWLQKTTKKSPKPWLLLGKANDPMPRQEATQNLWIRRSTIYQVSVFCSERILFLGAPEKIR